MADSFYFKANWDSSKFPHVQAPNRICAKYFYKVGLNVAWLIAEHKWVPEKNDQYDQGYRQALKDIQEQIMLEQKNND